MATKSDGGVGFVTVTAAGGPRMSQSYVKTAARGELENNMMPR